MSSDLKEAEFTKGLLQKNAEDIKDRGNRLPPRPLIRAIVALSASKPMKPLLIPGCGSGGFSSVRLGIFPC